MPHSCSQYDLIVLCISENDLERFAGDEDLSQLLSSGLTSNDLASDLNELQVMWMPLFPGLHYSSCVPLSLLILSHCRFVLKIKHVAVMQNLLACGRIESCEPVRVFNCSRSRTLVGHKQSLQGGNGKTPRFDSGNAHGMNLSRKPL